MDDKHLIDKEWEDIEALAKVVSAFKERHPETPMGFCVRSMEGHRVFKMGGEPETRSGLLCTLQALTDRQNVSDIEAGMPRLSQAEQKAYIEAMRRGGGGFGG